MIKTILTATDGSKQATKALELAADFANKYAAKLVIMNVIEPGGVPEGLRQMAEVEHITKPRAADNLVPEAAVPHTDTAGMRQDAEIHKFVSNQLLSKARKMAKHKGVSDIVEFSELGNPAKRILKAAKKYDADMIVLGSRGLGKFKGLLVGSVSHKVSQLAKCTCVTVR